MAVGRTTLKGYFNNGDMPTGAQFATMIDEFALQAQLDLINLSNSTLITRANGGEPNGETALVVDSTSGFATGDTIGFSTANGYQERTITVTNGTTFTVSAIDGALADNAIIGLVPPMINSAANGILYGNGVTPTLPDTIEHIGLRKYFAESYGITESTSASANKTALEAIVTDIGANGGIIEFPSGTFDFGGLAAGITMGNRIVVRGQGPQETIFQGDGSGDSSGVLLVKNSCLIMGIGFDNFSDIVIKLSEQDQLHDIDEVEIIDCRFTNGDPSNSDSIAIKDARTGKGTTTDVLVHRCVFDDMYAGVWITNNLSERVTVTNCFGSNLAFGGVVVGNANVDPSSGADQDTMGKYIIANNHFYRIGTYALSSHAGEAHGIIAFGNYVSIHHNIIQKVDSTAATGAEGIYTKARWGSIDHNILVDAGGSEAAIVLKGQTREETPGTAPSGYAVQVNANVIWFDPSWKSRRVAFTSGGTYEIQVNDTITGATSGATATVQYVSLTSGSWAGGDAAGTLRLTGQSGTFQSENLNVGANSNVATIGDNSAVVDLTGITVKQDDSGVTNNWIYNATDIGINVANAPSANVDDNHIINCRGDIGIHVAALANKRRMFVRRNQISGLTGAADGLTTLYAIKVDPGIAANTIQHLDLSDNTIEYVDAPRTLAFTSGGTHEPSVGDVLTGATGGATAQIESIALTSGSWAGGDAAGDFTVVMQHGTFQAENLNAGAITNIATIAGNSSAGTATTYGIYSDASVGSVEDVRIFGNGFYNLDTGIDLNGANDDRFWIDFNWFFGVTTTINGTTGSIWIGENNKGHSDTGHTWGSGDATPTVVPRRAFYKTANAAPTTITTFDGPYTGQKIWVIFGDGNTTVDFTGTNLKGNGGADWTPAQNDSMICVYDGTNWICHIHDNTA